MSDKTARPTKKPQWLISEVFPFVRQMSLRLVVAVPIHPGRFHRDFFIMTTSLTKIKCSHDEKALVLDWTMARMTIEDLSHFSIFALFSNAGISCFPAAMDGSKRPLGVWKPFQSSIPTKSEVLSFHRNWGLELGIATICGVVSGGLEVLDFDDGNLFDPWRRSCSVGIAERLPVIETPSGGYHVYYRCDQVSGNHKIAMTVKADGKADEVLIETRGEGGYVLSPGSPSKCHPTGLPYVQVAGPVLPEVPRITIDERRELWRAARTFDQRKPFEELVKAKARELKARSVSSDKTSDTLRPGDDFDDRGEWSWILEAHGWRSGNGMEWTRPGKDSGCSANIVLAANAQEVLHVFSSNAGPLECRSYGKFEAYTVLSHGGDSSEAAKVLRTRGYGAAHHRSTQPTEVQTLIQATTLYRKKVAI